ncbi:hypothetical protein BYT27DRAFT_7265396 [Phlegmacium glaucopus]|nr:hypothetical protein BYT27DRAFT_7265396 [Phlegmacium glaucopus]
MVQLKDVTNAMMDNLQREFVYLKKKLGRQALVLDVGGKWREWTAVVNKLVANLTSQVHSLLVIHLNSPLTILLFTRYKAVALGDLSNQIKVDAQGEIIRSGHIFSGPAEVTRVTLEVGNQGKLGGQAHVPDVEGVWFGTSIECLPLLRIRYGQLQLSRPPSLGLTRKIEISVEGVNIERYFFFLTGLWTLFQLSCFGGTVNPMVDQLSASVSEVTRVALEVGTQGIFGGQARDEGVRGTWADLTRNVNASNLTDQVRSFSEVMKAIALGELGNCVNVDVQGETPELNMNDCQLHGRSAEHIG